MKIAIYAIAKNESQMCEAFMRNIKAEADLVVVTDTGSTDDTVVKLKDLGAEVFNAVINPWRFDVARNMALAGVPKDFDWCFNLDMDEVPEPGWREALEANADGAHMLKPEFIWSCLPNGQPDLVYRHTRIHTRHDFTWTFPVHECLRYIGSGPYVDRNCDITIRHHPDNNKSRSSYMPLLELGVKEEPGSSRARYYYARELFFNRRYDEARTEFEKYLTLSHWPTEKADAMRKLAAIAKAQGQSDQELSWLNRATREAPGEREAWVMLSQYYFDRKHYLGGYLAAKRAISISQRTDFFTEGFAWGSRPYDLAGTCAFYIGLKDDFETFTKKALELEPSNERIRQNIKTFCKDTEVMALNLNR